MARALQRHSGRLHLWHQQQGRWRLVVLGALLGHGKPRRHGVAAVHREEACGRASERDALAIAECAAASAHL